MIKSGGYSELEKIRGMSGKSEGYKLLEKLFDNSGFDDLNSLFMQGEEGAGVICGFGNVGGKPVYAFAQSTDINAGAMSQIHALKISRLYSMALKNGCPVVGIYNSKGACLEEGNKILDAYGKLMSYCSRLSGVIPQISIIAGPCFGASAVMASCADIVIVSGASDLDIDIGGNDSGWEKSCENGVGNIISEDVDQAISYASKILSMLPKNNLSVADKLKFSDPSNICPSDNTPFEIVNSVFDKESFIEINKDFGRNISVGFATLYGEATGIIVAYSKDGSLTDADSCAKAARFVRLCDSYSVPVITFAEIYGFEALREAARLCSAYSDATTVKISIVTGRIYGSAYSCIFGGDISDISYAWEDAVISALAPQTAVEVLWKDRLHGDGVDPKASRQTVVDEYIKNEASAVRAVRDGIIDDVIFREETREKISNALHMMLSKREARLPKKHSNMQI